MDHADYIKLNAQLNAYRKEAVVRSAEWINERVQGITVDNTFSDPNAYNVGLAETIGVDRGVFRVWLTHNTDESNTSTICLPATLLDGIELAPEVKGPAAEPETRFQASALTGLLRAAGFEVLVQQTGGHTATIYATRGGITVIGGPGKYNWSNPDGSHFDTDDFYVGVEDNEDGGKRVHPGASMVAIAAIFGSEAGAAA